jgi:hypothetical protein
MVQTKQIKERETATLRNILILNRDTAKIKAMTTFHHSEAPQDTRNTTNNTMGIPNLTQTLKIIPITQNQIPKDRAQDLTIPMTYASNNNELIRMITEEIKAMTPALSRGTKDNLNIPQQAHAKRISQTSTRAKFNIISNPEEVKREVNHKNQDILMRGGTNTTVVTKAERIRADHENHNM